VLTIDALMIELGNFRKMPLVHVYKKCLLIVEREGDDMLGYDEVCDLFELLAGYDYCGFCHSFTQAVGCT
jgi:hypothetical protein